MSSPGSSQYWARECYKLLLMLVGWGQDVIGSVIGSADVEVARIAELVDGWMELRVSSES